METSSSITSTKPTPNPNSQPRGVFRVSTIELILSVMVAYVWPEPMISCDMIYVFTTGFGFVSLARYVVLGLVFRSVRTP